MAGLASLSPSFLAIDLSMSDKRRTRTPPKAPVAPATAKPDKKQQPKAKQPRPQKSEPVVTSHMRNMLAEEDRAYANAERALDLVLCPDQLEQTTALRLPVVPTREPVPQVNNLYYGSVMSTFDARNLIVTAPGQHSMVFMIRNTVAAWWTAGQMLAINIGSPQLSFSPFNNGVVAGRVPRQIPDAVAGFILGMNQSVAAPAQQPPVPTPINYSGSLWHSFYDPATQTFTVVPGVVTNARVLLCGEVESDAGKNGGANANFGFSFYATPTAIIPGVDSTLSVTPIPFSNGADVRRITNLTGEPHYAPNDRTSYPGVYPSSNNRLKIYSALTASGLGVTNYFCGGGASGVFPQVEYRSQATVTPARSAALPVADLATRSRQLTMTTLNPADKDWSGCNMRSAVISDGDMIGEIVVFDLAYAGDGMVDGGTTDNNGNMFPNNIAKAGWGDCCGFSLTFLDGVTGAAAADARVSVPYVLRADVWETRFVNALSALPARVGVYTPQWAALLQQSATWPGLASYHSFKDYFRSAYAAVKKVGLTAARAAWGAAKDVAVTAAIGALLA